jgi:hypothetical protein
MPMMHIPATNRKARRVDSWKSRISVFIKEVLIQGNPSAISSRSAPKAKPGQACLKGWKADNICFQKSNMLHDNQLQRQACAG